MTVDEKNPSAALGSSRLTAALAPVRVATSPPHSPGLRPPCIRVLLSGLSETVTAVGKSPPGAARQADVGVGRKPAPAFLPVVKR